ncbi:Alpha/Beta hydrolase protein [Trametes polyzona]|nr:Alpha/Beta hydrolase protein [Trametes polyzona]
MATAGGLYVYKDSGPPSGVRDDYTTLLIVHGYVWHGGTFSRLFPFAAAHGVRIIALNRREYPGSTPYTAEERAMLPSVPKQPLTNEREIHSAKQMLETFMRDRALDLYRTIEDLIVQLRLPTIKTDSGTGGVVLVGWSLGATFMMALLRHITEFPVGTVNLRDYVRRVVLSDPPSCLLGHPYPEQDPYNPLFDTSLSYEERGKVFTNWITSYFAHGDTLETFERRNALQDPPSTIARMSKEDFEATVHVPPGVPGGSDWTLLHGCAALGVYATLREGALYLREPSATGTEHTAAVGDEWRDVEVRYVWGDRSVWEVPYAVQLLRREMDEAKRAGKPMRNFTLRRIAGANHFAQWDYPEQTLVAFLSGQEECDA